MSMLNIENLTYIYPEQTEPVFENATAAFPDHGFFLLSGISGCGKTTLLNLINGSLIPQEGTVVFDGARYENLSESDLVKITKDHIAYIYQDFRLLEQMTVYENLRLITEDEQKILSVLKIIRMKKLQNIKVRKLSTGEKQRVAIARAFLEDKRVLLCDEATANLDPSNRRIIVSALKEISQYSLVIAVSHQQELYEDEVDGIFQIVDKKIEFRQINEISSVAPREKKEFVSSDKSNSFFVRPYTKNILKNAIFLLLVVIVMGSFNLISLGNNYDANVNYTSYIEGENCLYFSGTKQELEEQLPHRSIVDQPMFYSSNLELANFIYCDSVQPEETYRIYSEELQITHLTARINPIATQKVRIGRNRSEKNEITLGLPKKMEKKALKFPLLERDYPIRHKLVSQSPMYEDFVITGYYFLPASEDSGMIEINMDYLQSDIRKEEAFRRNQFLIGRGTIGLVDIDFSMDYALMSNEIHNFSLIFEDKYYVLDLSDFAVDINFGSSRAKVNVNPAKLVSVFSQLELGYKVFYEDTQQMKEDLLKTDKAFFPRGKGLNKVDNQTNQQDGFLLLYIGFSSGAALFALFTVLRYLTDRRMRKDLELLSWLHFSQKEIRRIFDLFDSISCFAAALLLIPVLCVENVFFEAASAWALLLIYLFTLVEILFFEWLRKRIVYRSKSA